MSASSRTPSLTPSRSPSPQPPLQPDHFYGTEGNPLPPSPRSDGKTWLDPADDPLAIRGIPVFKPTMEEFQDFEGYMNKVECWGSRSGIVKVIPPKEWKDALPSLNDKLANVRLNHPIEQHMVGRTGLFRQQNMEKSRNMSVREWAELCNHPDLRAPGVDDMDARGDASSAAQPRGRRGKKKPAEDAEAAVIKVEDDPQTSLASPPHTVSTPITPARPLEGSVDPDHQEFEVPTPVPALEDEEENKPQTSKTKGKRKGPTRAKKEERLAERAAKDVEFLETFDPDSDWLPDNTTPFDYTPEFCHQLERKFWRTCGLGKPAWYGADMQGSLFTDETTAWNVAHLPSLLDRIMPKSRAGLPGVNTPYLYFGMWRATFAWHVEDMDLFSINYIHFGAGKFWYAIPQQRANPFENIMRGFFPEGPSRCPQFLRHKAYLASPEKLKKFSCKPNTVVQQAGEFVITYPRGYHAGFNLGFNCAESVNFALDSWLELGRKAKACNCVSDSVRIDVDELLRECEEERMAEMGMEVEEGGAEDIGAQVWAEVQEAKPKTKPRVSRKRKSDEVETGEKTNKPPRTKKAKTSSPASASASSSSPTKRSLILKLGLKPQEDFPCCLCVSPSREGLLPVHAPPRGQNPAYKDVKEWMAHEHCASVVPETWVDEVEGPGVLQEDGSIVKASAVFGVDAIVKDRWNLRCSTCSKHRAKTHGAPVQCTKGKCPKAFHVSCAREAADVDYQIVKAVEKEVVIYDPEEDKPPPMDVDGVSGGTSGELAHHPPYKTVQKLEIALLCPQHNPTVIEAKKASKQDRLRQDLLALPPNARIKIRGSSGVFEVTLVRVLEATKSVEVIWDRGLKREFKWGSIVTGEMEGKEVIQKPVEAAVDAVGQAAMTYPSFSLSLAASTPGASSSSSTPSVPTPLPNPHLPPSQYIQYQPRASGQYPLAPKPPLGAWAAYGPYAVPVPYPPGGAGYDYAATNAYVQAYAQARAKGMAYPYAGYGIPQGQQGVGKGEGGEGQKKYAGIQWKQPYTGPREKSQSGSRASSVIGADGQASGGEVTPALTPVPVSSGAVGVEGDPGTLDPTLAAVGGMSA